MTGVYLRSDMKTSPPASGVLLIIEVDMKKKFLETGKIVGTHGIRGMVRIQPWSDSGEFLSSFDRFFLDDKGADSIAVKDIHPHGNVVIAKLEGVDSIEQAEQLRGKVIYLDRDDVDLPEGRYFIDDLVGCEVYSADGVTLLGTLSDVSQTGANDVWHVTKDGKEYLVPAIEQVIVSVDIDAAKIVLDPMKGIFEDAD